MPGYKTVNLEAGMPFADAAIRRLTWELHAAKRMGFSAFKLIHGYGSSGTGGKLRTESRRYLARMKASGQIKDYIPGEQLSIFDEQTRAAFLKCPELRRDSDLERHNNGVTVVVL